MNPKPMTWMTTVRTINGRPHAQSAVQTPGVETYKPRAAWAILMASTLVRSVARVIGKNGRCQEASFDESELCADQPGCRALHDRDRLTPGFPVRVRKISYMRVVRILSSDVQLLTDSIHNYAIYVVCPIRQSAEAHRQVHCILGIVHVGSDLETKQRLLRSVEDQGHRILRFQVVVDYELNSIRRARDRSQHDVPLREGPLQKLTVGWHILLRQCFHRVRVVFVFFFLLLDYVLFQTPSAWGVGRRVHGDLLWLSVWSEAHLEVLLFFLFAFQADRYQLVPAIGGECLLVPRHCFFDLRNPLLQFRALCAGATNESRSSQEAE